ncbi:hypothetical protein ABT169_17840 [Streptomyces sp. NPDC001616]|uniref:hypothetical protein n=1 Tax=Streptomyces sp. NPDC001616 TaxID=3156648 RepID=UPI00332908F7
MNPPTQSPPSSHRAPRRRILRDLLGLFLIGSGTVGLLGALYTANPLVTLFLAGLVLCVGGYAVLNTTPLLHPAVRLVAGYCALSLGLTVLAGLAFSFTPWSLLFALLVAFGVYLSSEGD